MRKEHGIFNKNTDFKVHTVHWLCVQQYMKYCYAYSEREREMFYLTMTSTHFINGYMASDIWLRTILTVRKETRCRHIGYSYRLTARIVLYAPSHRQDNTYHGLCYTSCGALAGTRNSSMGCIFRVPHVQHICLLKPIQYGHRTGTLLENHQ